MIQFEVGKTYRYGNHFYTVTKRTACFVFFSDNEGKTFRAKPKTDSKKEYEELYITFCLINAKYDLVNTETATPRLQPLRLT